MNSTMVVLVGKGCSMRTHLWWVRGAIVYTCGFVSKLEMDFTFNPTLPTLLHPLYVYDIIISFRHQVRPIHNTYI